MNIITLDIGGTAVKYGLFYDRTEQFGQFSVYNSAGAEDIQGNLYKFLDEHRADMIGICVPGPFDFKTGTSKMKHKLTSIYDVSLKESLAKRYKNTKVQFVHDSTAFAYGVLHEMPGLSKEIFSCVMLGTGLGYVNVLLGTVMLNENDTPINPMWNMKYLDGIAEDYVSTNTLLRQAEEKGCNFKNIKDMADSARAGNADVLAVFKEFGENLGKCIEIKRKEDSFSRIVIGGQISKSFDLIRDGFLNETDIEYSLVNNPSTCALYGLKNYMRRIM